MARKTENKLKALQESASRNKKLYQYEKPNAALLETFKRPASMNKDVHCEMLIRIEVAEFTSLCPLTGQPDFAKIIIEYKPNNYCVESKSLKLYMLGYRQYGAFHESCVQQMVDDFVKVVDPQWLRIKGEFAPRGGIPFWPTVSYSKSLNSY